MTDPYLSKPRCAAGVVVLVIFLSSQLQLMWVALILVWSLFDKCTAGVSGRATHVAFRANLVFTDKWDMHEV